MLVNHTHERLAALGLPGMAKAFDDQLRQPDTAALTFEVRLGLMIDREVTERDNKRLIHTPEVRRFASGCSHRGYRSADTARHRARLLRQACRW